MHSKDMYIYMYMYILCMYIYIHMYIYIYPRGLGFSDGEAVGWGGACCRHVHVTLMLR